MRRLWLITFSVASFVGSGCSCAEPSTPACPNCGAHGSCVPAEAKCMCDTGYAGDACNRCDADHVRIGDLCVPGNCVDSSDCSDGDACNGVETCGAAHRCQAGSAVNCGAHGLCEPSDGTCTCDSGWGSDNCSDCTTGFVRVGNDCAQAACMTDDECSDANLCTGLETCGPDHACAAGMPVDCGDHGSCDAFSGACVCDTGYAGEACGTCDDGYADVQGQCLPETCSSHDDCDDGQVCNGQETCSPASVCRPGTAVVCGSHAHCEEPTSACVCDDGHELRGGTCTAIRCDVPQAPTLSVIHGGATLTWTVPGGLPLQVGTASDANALVPDSWFDSASTTLPSTGMPRIVKAFARVAGPGCLASNPFAFTYEVREAYPPAAGQSGSGAVTKDDPSIVGWATGWVEPVSYGSNVDDTWKHPERAVGPAEGNSTGIVSLGRGGSIVLEFAPPIANGPGSDFAVFENGFTDEFLELGFVEVSSNGTDFIRFDTAYLGLDPIGAYGGQPTTQIGQLAGKYRQGFGTPFDLATLVNRRQVREAIVDLSAIRFIRIVDAVGDGSATDSFGNVIYDPYPTTGSAGFDLDAVAVLNGG